LIYGSTVFLVKDAYEVAVELCYEAAEKFGWYNRSCAINPYLVEGKKTVAYEICEQLNWEVPDIVTVAVGDGCTIAGVWKGFHECFELGLTSSVPKIIGIQAAGANPITRAYEHKTREFDYQEADTVADSICVAVPRNGIKALNAIEESFGMMIDVTDEEILEAMKILARGVGVFGEPAGVTGFAGVLKLKELGLITGNEKIACIVTGSGLKDIKSAIRAAGSAYEVSPSLSDIEDVLRKQQA
jgi:threonine synthase